MKATERYFPLVLFILLYKVVLTFESGNEILKCDHSNEISSAVLSLVTIRLAVSHKVRSENVLNFDNGLIFGGERITETNKEKIAVLWFPTCVQFSTR